MGLIRAMIRTRRGSELSREALAKLQQRRLNELVRYAREHSPYYRQLYSGVGERFCLEDLPVTSKPEMMADLDRVFTDGVYGFKVDQGETYFGKTVTTSIGEMSNREYFNQTYMGAASVSFSSTMGRLVGELVAK